MKLYILKSLLKGKQKRIMLVVELFFSFLAFFLILTFIVSEIYNTKYPLGFDSGNMYTLHWDINTTSNDREFYQKKQNEIVEFIKAHPNVRNFGKCKSSFFFTKGYMNPSKPLKSNDVVIPQTKVNQMLVSDEIAEILDIGILEGRWFSAEDNASKKRPVVLTQNLRQELFGNTKALGEIVDYCEQQCIVVGVANNIKHKGDFTQPDLTLFIRNTQVENLQYETSFCMSGSNCGDIIFLKCKDASEAFEAELTRKVSSNYPGFRIKLYSVEKIREKYIRSTWIPLIVVFLTITALFLNVLFGLFGVLWYNISQRRSEVGLRMAVGASKSDIYKQFIYEMLLLATIAIIPGILVAIQFPILNLFNMESVVYVIAMIAATVVIYVLVALCALLPSSRATKIQPAIALHDE